MIRSALALFGFARAGVAPLEDARLARALSGDGAAYASLVRDHVPVLLRVTQRVTGDADLAEDAVAETLAVAHRQLSRYQPGTSLRAFLLGIAVKRAHTLLRAERRRHHRETAAEHAPTPSVGPEAALRGRELTVRIRAALEALPRKRREAALLRLDGGLEHAEIATAMGLREDAARALVSLAMRDLRTALDAEQTV